MARMFDAEHLCAIRPSVSTGLRRILSAGNLANPIAHISEPTTVVGARLPVSLGDNRHPFF